MAMILYFADVQELPRHFFTHWDNEREQPVHP
jgi:hypothetical protein